MCSFANRLHLWCSQMLIALSRRLKNVVLLLAFVVICALFWTLQLPPHQNDVSSNLLPSSKRRPQSPQNLLSLQAPAPQLYNRGETSSSDPRRVQKRRSESQYFNKPRLTPDGRTEVIEETAINRPDSRAKIENEENNEKVIIEDAFNAVQLQPLPSDIDTNSNQVSNKINPQTFSLLSNYRSHEEYFDLLLDGFNKRKMIFYY